MGRPQKFQQIWPGLLRIVRHFWPYIRKQRVLIGGALLALFAQVALRLLEPWPLKFVFDRVIVIGPTDGKLGISPIDALDPMLLLALSALAVVVIAGLRALATYSSKVGFALAGQRVVSKVRGELYRHLQYLSLSFHTQARSGDLVVRVIGDVGMLREVLVTALLPLLAQVLILIGMVALMFWFSWPLTLLVLATLPLFWVRTVRLSRRIQKVAREQRQRRGAMAATATESIGAIKTIQALSLQDTFAEVFVGQERKNLKEGVKAKRLEARLQRTVAIIVAIGTALTLFFGARLVLSKALTPGDLLVFLHYLKSAFRPAQSFAKYTGRLAKASAAGERILDVLRQVPEVRDLPGSVDAPAFTGSVLFEGVSFAYQGEQQVLKEIELEARPGQTVALVGPSGGGKSTLVSLILRLYDPTQGRVIIDGHDVRDYTLESLRSQISIVLQDNLLFAASVRENIAYGLPKATAEQIEASARLAQAHEFIQALPLGYDTLLGERGATLSHGQRQRIAIARAAIREAPILILDEPTTGLDEENARMVVEALERLSKGSTTFLITHSLRLAAGADRIFYLDNGRILERGTHMELMQASGPYSALYQQEVATIDHGTHQEDSNVVAT